MSQGYAVANSLSGLLATAFTWSSAFTTNRARLNDSVMDELAASAASAQASGQTLSIDLGSARALAGFALLNHNLASGACTVSVTAGADGITYGTTAKAASTIVTTAPNQKDTVLQFPSATFRYWRLTFVHTGTKTVTLGEVLALAAITVLSRSGIYGDGESEKAILNNNVSQTGQQRTTFIGGPLRTKRMTYRDLSPADKAELRLMWMATTYGTSNLLWVEFIESLATAATDAGQECLWGKLQDGFDWTQDDYLLFNISSFTITGQGREVGS